jgi:hypothetical protein
MRTVISTVYSALYGIAGIAVYLIIRVIGSLVADQVKAWLPGLRAWVVRRQAAEMGAESGRFEEEWLGHLDRTPGELGKLWIVLPLFFVPARTALERWVDSPDRLKNLAARAILDHGWVSVAAAFIWVCLCYPPSPTRSAAYFVLIPLVTGPLLMLNRRVRLALNSFYEDSLTYPGRVVVGAMVVPVLAWMIVSWSFVPTTGPTPSARKFARERARPTIFFVPQLPSSADSRVTALNDPQAQLPLMRGTPRSGRVVLSIDKVQHNVPLPGVQKAPTELLAAQELPSPPSFLAEPADPLQIPGALFPQQPLPAFQESPIGFAPAAPTNVRLIR